MYCTFIFLYFFIYTFLTHQTLYFHTTTLTSIKGLMIDTSKCFFLPSSPPPPQITNPRTQDYNTCSRNPIFMSAQAHDIDIIFKFIVRLYIFFFFCYDRIYLFSFCRYPVKEHFYWWYITLQFLFTLCMISRLLPSTQRKQKKKIIQILIHFMFINHLWEGCMMSFPLFMTKPILHW